jgi:hypothetical protein
MSNLKVIIDPSVKGVFEKYPEMVRVKLFAMRQLILDTASAIESIDTIEETLKWGEPSYLAKKGSTIRINHKKSQPEQYCIYFKCTSLLVKTFRILYKNQFTYEGNRAIVFDLKDEIPEPELKHCIALALTYHRVKHLPLLGS